MTFVSKKLFALCNTGGVAAAKYKESETLKRFFRCHFIKRIMGVIIPEVEKGLQFKWTVSMGWS